MDQVQPVKPPEVIELHIRNYRTLLKSHGEVSINQLIHSHTAMQSILHEKAGSSEVDMAAFTYALLRLPKCITEVNKIILGQSYTVFKKNDYATIDSWEEVVSSGRRRKMYFDAQETLAVYIASVTDVDDIITLLTAFQIEWNKLYGLLKTTPEKSLEKVIAEEDVDRLQTILGESYTEFLEKISHKELNFSVWLSSGSYTEYMRSTQYWWNNVPKYVKRNILDCPIYFVSSNTHSLINLLTRVAVEEKPKLIDFLHTLNDPNLSAFWEAIEKKTSGANEEFFLHYLAKKYSKDHPEYVTKQKQREKQLGIYTITPYHYLDVTVQVIDVKKLAGVRLDPRIAEDTSYLRGSNAIIINIDYPLGWAAYQILTEIAQNVDEIRGMYLMGKAAIIEGSIGDITLPSSVFDQHSKNLYVFNNAFTPADLEPVFKTGAVFADQKSLTVKGTFFQNIKTIEDWFGQGFGSIEMEAGPYLNAIYECVYYNRYVENQFVSLLNTPFEIGIAHYASDTPKSKAKNLGVRNLSYEGVESTYGISLAILKKILDREKVLLSK